MKVLLILVLSFALSLTTKAKGVTLDSTETLLLGTWQFDSLPNINLVFDNTRDTFSIKETDKSNPDWYIKYKIIFHLELKEMGGGTGYTLMQTESSDNKAGYKYQNNYQVRVLTKKKLILLMTNGVPLIRSNVYRFTRVSG